MRKQDPISVSPPWWAQASVDTASLASSATRVTKLLRSIDPTKVKPEELDVLVDLLSGFSDTADALTAELAAVLDGTSTYIVRDGTGEPGDEPCRPGGDRPDLLAISQGYLAGHVAGDTVIDERVWDYGDGPDALPDAIEAVAKRLRELPPEDRKVANVFVLMNEAVEPVKQEPTKQAPKRG